MPGRLTHDRRILLLALLSGLPAVLVALLLVVPFTLGRALRALPALSALVIVVAGLAMTAHAIPKVR